MKIQEVLLRVMVRKLDPKDAVQVTGRIGVPQNVPYASSPCATVRAFSLLQQECFRAG